MIGYAKHTDTVLCCINWELLSPVSGAFAFGAFILHCIFIYTRKLIKKMEIGLRT